MTPNKDQNLKSLTNSQLDAYAAKFLEGQRRGKYSRDEEEVIQTKLMRERNERFMAENPPNR